MFWLVNQQDGQYIGDYGDDQIGRIFNLEYWVVIQCYIVDCFVVDGSNDVEYQDVEWVYM